MPTAVGPNTKGEENLVFGYDLGDVSNSYKGEPTENLITDTAAFDSSFWNQKNGTITANDVIGPRGIQNAAKIVATNTDPYIYSSAIVTASTGNNTWSIWVKGTGNTIGKSAQVRINFSGTATGTADTNASVNLTERWQLLQTTANVTSGGTIKFGLEAPNGAVSGDIMYFADPMFEQKSHATPFTAGTRSATQGLIDLTGNSTIDLTNVSFDSNAQMTFDGSNDYGTISDATLFDFGTGDFSMEAVVQGTGTNDYRTVFYHYYNPGFVYITMITTGTMRVWINGQVLNGTTNILDGNYHHTALVRQGDVLSLYVDGELDASSTGWADKTATNTSKGASIGRYIDGSSAYPWNGEIPVVKAYNRALTASEIKANYNAIKGRFNI